MKNYLYHMYEQALLNWMTHSVVQIEKFIECCHDNTLEPWFVRWPASLKKYSDLLIIFSFAAYLEACV